MSTEKESDKKTCNFGEHVTLDGYKGNPEKLDDINLVYSFLNDLPDKLGMLKLGAPIIYKAEPNNKKDPGGWTGVVIIAESHISIHTFPKRGFVTADAYTCKNGLDVDFIKKFITDMFDLKELEVNLIKRGTMYPCEDIA